MGSPTMQTLQDPILLLPWLCFRGGGFPNPREPTAAASDGFHSLRAADCRGNIAETEASERLKREHKKAWEQDALKVRGTPPRTRPPDAIDPSQARTISITKRFSTGGC
jgi:hypothetical protein